MLQYNLLLCSLLVAVIGWISSISHMSFHFIPSSSLSSSLSFDASWRPAEDPLASIPLRIASISLRPSCYLSTISFSISPLPSPPLPLLPLILSLQDLISIHYRLADQRKSVEMASRRVGLALPEWPETKEERLEREKEDAEVMVAHMKLQEAAARMQVWPNRKGEGRVEWGGVGWGR